MFQKGHKKVGGRKLGWTAEPAEVKFFFLSKSMDAAKEVIRLSQSKKSKPSDKLKAAEMILDRAMGKPKQEIENTLVTPEKLPFSVKIEGASG